MIPRMQIRKLSSMIRVATIIQHGKIIPRWFERLDTVGNDRVQIKEVCYTWSHYDGAAKILHYAVYDGSNTFQLSLNTISFTWVLSIAEE